MFKKVSVFLLVFSLSLLAIERSVSASSYSSGSKSSSSRSSGSSSRSYSSSSSGKSYSSGSKSSSSSSSSGSKSGSSSGFKSSSSSSKGFSFFGKAEKAQAKADSKATFAKYKSTQQSKPDTWRPAGYDYLKSQPKETYATRTTRQQTVFKTYVSQPMQPQAVDSTWNPYFWMWMMDHRDRQAEWVYNHRSEISDERYKELVAKNKDLEAEVKALEDKKVVKDPNYAPKEIDKDLMYSDDYVKAVQEAEEPKDDDSDFNWFLWLLVFPASLALGGWAVYAIFFKKREF